MLCFGLEVKSSSNIIQVINSTYGDEEARLLNTIVTVNEHMENACTEEISIFATNITENVFKGLIVITPGKIKVSDMEFKVREYFSFYPFLNVKMKFEEITVFNFMKSIRTANEVNHLSGMVRDVRERFKLDYFDNYSFTVKQSIVEQSNLSEAEANLKASEIMSDKSMLDEIKRIHSPTNPKKFFGHPVHYKVQAGNIDAAYEIVELLVACLYSNKRVLGRRIDKISNIAEGCFDEIDLENLFENSRGETIVVELRGSIEEHNNFASNYERTVEYFEKLIKRHSRETLFIFIELVDHPGFSKIFMNSISEHVDVIELLEGAGNREEAKKYLENLMDQSELSEYKEVSNDTFQFTKSAYTASDIHKMYKNWDSECLRSQVYTSYTKCEPLKVAEKNEKGKSYEFLQQLIGLSEVKGIVEQIIASARMEKLRQSYSVDKFNPSMHMIFTGNPGSAKTTVARLLADILKENKVLGTGVFIECGRADLVGKYVGWTAEKVKKKFRMARGGILFIDEAYALVDDSNSYGDEAINTIVQEMENYRDRLIVIFAGYPDKMKEFVDKNDGLRSRISYYVDFLDYNEEELLKILEMMAEENGYTISKEGKIKCGTIFHKALKHRHFGNGRSVRNLLEQAIMRQSLRLSLDFDEKEIERDIIFQLEKADFDIQTTLQKEKKQVIGFAV